MNGHHVDYDVLADLAEGLLEEQPATSVRAHLEKCAECRDRSDDLQSVSQILAAAPLPPLPESLAARLDAAVLAEATEGAPVIDLAARRRMRMQRVFAAAAAVAVVSGVGAALANGALEAGSEQAAPAALLWGRTPVPVASADELPLVTSATRYQDATLAAQVEDQLDRSKDVRAGTVPPRILDCVKAVAGPAAQVLLVDNAWFDGREATVIVVSDGRADDALVYAVGAQCSAQEPDLFATTRISG
ncbi:hypothetical protein [Actinocorallia libanotica]|uniref:Zinc finger protein n=1 Tax=Actinocorallia libanotica TaxID=46162 RepID=A0ABN1QCI3_9ACTN